MNSRLETLTAKYQSLGDEQLALSEDKLSLSAKLE